MLASPCYQQSPTSASVIMSKSTPFAHRANSFSLFTEWGMPSFPTASSGPPGLRTPARDHPPGPVVSLLPARSSHVLSTNIAIGTIGHPNHQGQVFTSAFAAASRREPNFFPFLLPRPGGRGGSAHSTNCVALPQCRAMGLPAVASRLRRLRRLGKCVLCSTLWPPFQLRCSRAV